MVMRPAPGAKAERPRLWAREGRGGQRAVGPQPRECPWPPACPWGPQAGDKRESCHGDVPVKAAPGGDSNRNTEAATLRDVAGDSRSSPGFMLQAGVN